MADKSAPKRETPRKNVDEELFERLAAVERARRARALAAGIVIALFLIGGLTLSLVYREAVFTPRIDIDAGEKESLNQTNDPQCRAVIADVTAIGRDYVDFEPQLDALLGEDAQAIDALKSELEALKARLAAAKKDAESAELRFDNTRTELNEWFDYVDNELTLLQRLGEDQHAELAKDNPPADDGETPAADKPAPRSKLSFPERLSGATLATSEAFQKFRVWHTGGLHPCGAASEGEVGWQPATAAVNGDK